MILGALLLSACSSVSPEDKASQETISYTLATGAQGKVKDQKLSLSHADLTFVIHPNRKRIEGAARLTLSTDTPVKDIYIDLDSRFTIHQIQFNGKPLNKHQFTHDNGLITVLSQKTRVGDFNIRIEYEGAPRIAIRAPWDGGFVWSTTQAGEHWIATAVQGEGCDLFWPCIDQPFGEPQRVDMHIDVPSNLVAAANGLLTEVTELGNRKTYHWKTKSIHNTYGVSLNIAPYKTLSSQYNSLFGNTIKTVFYYLPENQTKAEALFEEFPKLLSFFEQVIGPYPFSHEKMGVVETPHLGMEHQTINAYGNAYKADKYGFDWLLQHEFSHEWFGNQMTNDDWDHMWLHEGFASYLQPLYAQYLHGDLAYHSYLYDRRLTILNEHPLVSNQSKAVHEVYDNNIGPGGDIYAKGAMVLHTLRQLIGDEAFFSVIRFLLYGTDKPTPESLNVRFSNTQEFIQIVNNVSKTDLGWFFDIYIFNAELPKLETQRNESKMMFSWKTTDDLPFPMPLELRVNGKVKVLNMLTNHSIDVTPDDVVIIDPNGKILREEDYINRYQAEQPSQ
jgi:aminopeptidase N